MRWIAGAVCLLGTAATAEPLTLKPLLDTRLRYETVEQDDVARRAEALTFRVRPGVEARSGRWSALVEGEVTTILSSGYNDGLNGKTRFPVIADPDNQEINRAQVRYAAPGLTATLGRQFIDLADSRFVGGAPFRQNEQTFDAARLQWGKPKGLTIDLTYAWSVRTINGIHGFGVRQQAVSGDDIFALASYATKFGTVTGFAYLLEQDERAVQGFRLASQTYGVRYVGGYTLAPDLKAALIASYARQSDYRRNPNEYSADYWLAEGALTRGPLTGKIGRETLGADDGRAFTSVQTPLASAFGFQGWADKFLTTPPDGIRDLYGSLAYNAKKVGATDLLTLTATYHRFTSDRLVRHYGNEVDLLATAKFGRTALTARYARYKADRFAADTDKFWLSADWVL